MVKKVLSAVALASVFAAAPAMAQTEIGRAHV